MSSLPQYQKFTLLRPDCSTGHNTLNLAEYMLLVLDESNLLVIVRSLPITDESVMDCSIGIGQFQVFFTKMLSMLVAMLYFGGPKWPNRFFKGIRVQHAVYY